MLRRWSIIAGALILSAGAATAISAAASASPATTVAHPGPVQIVGSTTTIKGQPGQLESTNWSGYADSTYESTAGDANSYSSVSGSWVEPTADCGPGDSFAAFWVGLDGFPSDTVEQDGTLIECQAGHATYLAWWEMYPSPLTPFSNTVEPGDHISASVKYLGNDNFQLYIADSTQDWSHTFIENLGQTPQLASAEAIAEAPCCASTGGQILPLANYGTVHFTNVTANGEPIGTASLNPYQLTMVNPKTAAPKSTCSGLGDDLESFSCTWVAEF
jgi:hypothetical protein